jgi:hypothetical protein
MKTWAGIRIEAFFAERCPCVAGKQLWVTKARVVGGLSTRRACSGVFKVVTKEAESHALIILKDKSARSI